MGEKLTYFSSFFFPQNNASCFLILRISVMINVQLDAVDIYRAGFQDQCIFALYYRT